MLGSVTGLKLVYWDEVDWKIKDYREPVIMIGHEEYAMASCSKDVPVNLAQVRPRYNATAAKIAKNYWEEAKLLSQNAKQEPLKIIHLVLDNFSRRHFYRKMPKTVVLLKEINKGDTHHVEDFLIYKIRGSGSVQNQIRILGSRFVKPSINPVKKDRIGDQAIWNLLAKIGFVSLFALESCNKDFAPMLGTQPHVTHAINEFFCGCKKHCNYDTDKTASKQRCIGRMMSHQYVFDYADEFSSLYADLNQWIYLHLDAAHESTGQHAGTLDDDLEIFVRKNTQRNTVIVVEGDHGMRYGDWFTTPQGFMEYRLPVLFLIIPHQIMLDYQYSYGLLKYNSQKLTTKQDLRTTILSIAYGWAGQNYPEDIMAYFLLRWSVDQHRSCATANINPWLCSCSQFITIEKLYLDSNYDEHELFSFTQFLALEAMTTIKEKNLAARYGKQICKDINFGKLNSVLYLKITLTRFMLKFDMSIAESDDVRFEVLVFVSTDIIYGIEESTYPIRTYYLRSHKSLFRIQYINRIDKYEGECEELAIKYHLEPQFCICDYHK